MFRARNTPFVWNVDRSRNVEALFEEELEAFIGRYRYGRGEAAKTSYSHRHRDRLLTLTFGTETLQVPRTPIKDEADKVIEWYPAELQCSVCHCRHSGCDAGKGSQ